MKTYDGYKKSLDHIDKGQSATVIPYFNVMRRLFEPEAVNAYQELFSRQEFPNPLRLQLCKINYSAYGLQLTFLKILNA